MTMPASDNPDFIALDMDPSINVATDADDNIALDMDADAQALDNAERDEMDAIDADERSEASNERDRRFVGPVAPIVEAATTEAFADHSNLASALASIVSPITGSTSGSLADGSMRGVGFSTAQGYATALANGVKAATAESYKATLRSTYNYTDDQIAALTITIIPESTLPSGAGITVEATGPSVFEQRRIALGLAPNARIPANMRPGARVATPEATPVAPPRIEGVLPREAVLANLANEGSGVYFSAGRADRRKTHNKLADMVTALGPEFQDLAPRVKSSKAQFGEVMRGIKNAYDRHSTIHAWNVTRADVQRKQQSWPADLASRWCVGLRDGSDQLGTLGEKVLVADLLVDGTIRFVGGTDETRARVIGEFDAKVGGAVFNSTDLLAWLRRTLESEFHAIETVGRYYIPGNHPVGGRLDRFRMAVTPLLGRGTAIDDVITGARLTEALLSGITEKLDGISEDYAEDCTKAQARDVAKLLKVNPEATEGEIAIVTRRAVVLSERAGTYLARINDAQAYVDGLAKLLGDDTAGVRARLAALRSTIEPLCDSTTAMGAAIELD